MIRWEDTFYSFPHRLGAHLCINSLYFNINTRIFFIKVYPNIVKIYNNLKKMRGRIKRVELASCKD